MQEMTDLEKTVAAVLDELKDFEIKDPLYSGYFIYYHNLLDVLKECRNKLIEFALPHVVSRFIIDQDHYEPDYPSLTLSVCVDMTPEEAIDYIHLFDHKYWYNASVPNGIRHWMSVDIEFI